MQVIARAKYIRMSPRKIRLVADLIRGLDVEKAKWQLTFNKRIASKTLIKILDSAVSNAVNNFELDKNNLKIEAIIVDGGPPLKRWLPRAHGRATPIRKETSHIKLTLAEIVASGKTKKVKKIDTSDIIKVGTGEFDELKAISAEKNKEEKPKAGAKVTAGKKGFASKVLNRKTGSK
jgi:large subunit ribosomal protein L22